MNKFIVVLIGVAGLSIATMATADVSRKPWGLPDPVRPPVAVKPALDLPRVAEVPLPIFTVQPLPTATGKVLELHEKLAGRLSKVVIVPEVRLRHFRWLDDHAFSVRGWHGFVEKADPIPGGHRVTLRVSPFVRSGSSTTILDHLIETYEVVFGHVRFVEAIHPPGSGQPSFLID